LDEPFSGIDPIIVGEAQEIIKDLRNKGLGILLTDHNVRETLSITDRAYLLFEGRVLFEGTSEELADNPIVREKYLGRDFVLRKREFQF
jgi:lipopolysaccharide export system ATP-binding protein